MANVRLIFNGAKGSETENHSLECFCNTENNIYISIDIGDYPPYCICLDKSTAIKFAKTLRTQINLIAEL